MNVQQPDPSERAFVGALLHLPAQQVVPLIGFVQHDDLDDPRLRVIYRLAGQLAVKGTRPDPAAVHGLARSSGAVMNADLPALTGLLVDLLTEVPIPQAATAYARSVVEASVRRRVTMAATRLSQAAEGSDVDTLAHLVADEAYALQTALQRLTVAPLEVVA